MLVLNIIREETTKKRLFFCKNKIRKSPERYNCHIGNKVYTIVDLYENQLDNVLVKRLLVINRNKVLKCNNYVINDRINEYLLDIKPYIKRALLSSVVNIIKEGCDIDSVCIRDSLFTDYDEYYALASLLRRMSVVCDNNAFISFQSKCYNNLGLYVDNRKTEEYRGYLDLDNVFENKTFFIIDGIDMLVYADEGYFEVDNNVGELLKFNVPKEYACASLYI